jgi:hypothetical protein
MNPGADGLPVFAFEIQLEPASGPAHAGFGEITCVALLLELVVAVELASAVESAFAFHTQPLAAISVITSPNFFTICFLRKNKPNVLAPITSYHTGIMQVGRQPAACAHWTYQPASPAQSTVFPREGNCASHSLDSQKRDTFCRRIHGEAGISRIAWSLARLRSALRYFCAPPPGINRIASRGEPSHHAYSYFAGAAGLPK